jgi:hypothetical protein
VALHSAYLTGAFHSLFLCFDRVFEGTAGSSHSGCVSESLGVVLCYSGLSVTNLLVLLLISLLLVSRAQFPLLSKVSLAIKSSMVFLGCCYHFDSKKEEKAAVGLDVSNGIDGDGQIGSALID